MPFDPSALTRLTDAALAEQAAGARQASAHAALADALTAIPDLTLLLATVRAERDRGWIAARENEELTWLRGLSEPALALVGRTGVAE